MKLSTEELGLDLVATRYLNRRWIRLRSTAQSRYPYIHEGVGPCTLWWTAGTMLSKHVMCCHVSPLLISIVISKGISNILSTSQYQ